MVPLRLSLLRVTFPGFVDAATLHARLSAVFGHGPDASDDRHRMLFRADADTTTGVPRTVALVQICGEPPAGSAVVVPGASHVEGPKSPLPTVAAGDVLRFFLRANPTRARGHGDAPGTPKLAWSRGRRSPLLDAGSRMEWLARKGVLAGFRVREARLHDAVVPDARSRTSLTVRLRHKHEDAVVTGADFEGSLFVTDSEALARAVGAGIGSGKAWGFGLLSLARPTR